MIIRAYEPERDKQAAYRIWREVGWLGDEDRHKEALDIWIAAGRALVGELYGEAESLVLTQPSSLRYLKGDLPFCAVTGVTTSHVARKQGLAGRVTATAVARDVAEGAVVAGLGMFEQGFYNRIGFGSGSYEPWLSFDPAQLRVEVPFRAPRRLSKDDYAAIHANRLARMRSHGAINIYPEAFTQTRTLWTKKPLGYGYYDGPEGALSHHVWMSTDNISHGPYRVIWMAYDTYEQFLELLALLKGLGDQVHAVSMSEPTGIQLQDLLTQPFKHFAVTEKSPYAWRMRAVSWWQMRICDLTACLAATHLGGDPVRFNLRLSDPIDRYLDEDEPWRGVAGEYTVTLGEESGAVTGSDPALPTMEATINAFTRLWLGVRPATGLAVTDDLVAPPDLLAALDELLRLPQPRVDWDF
jgi:predicted acetyltransferase